MTPDQEEDQLMEPFAKFAAENMERSLSMITAMFVGLYESYVDQVGGNVDEVINITGADGMRDITIHPSKPEHAGHALH